MFLLQYIVVIIVAFVDGRW